MVRPDKYQLSSMKKGQNRAKRVDFVNFDPITMISRIFLPLLATLCLALPLATTAQEAEKEAIRRLVMQETESYLGVDHEAWASTWLQVPYAYWSFSDKDGSQFISTWETIDRTFQSYFESQKPTKARISYTWQDIRVYTNGAYVRFQERSDDGRRVEVTDQIRVLEKRDGRWKIICMIAVVEETEQP